MSYNIETKSRIGIERKSSYSLISKIAITSPYRDRFARNPFENQQLTADALPTIRFLIKKKDFQISLMQTVVKCLM